MDWNGLVQGKGQWRDLLETVIKFLVPQNVGKYLSSCATSGFSRRVQLHGVSPFLIHAITIIIIII
jgi:hypothetical protein